MPPALAPSAAESATRSPAALRRLLPAALALLLALPLAVSGGRMLLAGLASYQAQAFLIDWERTAKEPTPRAAEIATRAAQRAAALYPTANGRYLQRLGHIQQWQHFRQPFGAPTAEASRRAALEAFRAAAQARPSWPDNWAALAYAKLYLREFDTEFRHALAQAARHGPWRIGINRKLAEIGLIAWPQFDPAERAALLEAARRTVAYSPGEARQLFALAQLTDTAGPLCDALGEALIGARKLACAPPHDTARPTRR